MVWPLIVAGGALAATGIGGSLASGALGKSTTPAPYNPDARAYQYGPDEEYYKKFLGRTYAAERDAQNRGAPEMDWTLANQDVERGLAVRGQQEQQAEDYRAVIEGRAGPSVSEQQLRAGQARNAQQAAQVAASARGGAGNAVLAQREAQRQAALGGLAVNRDAAMLRTQEQQQARQERAGLLASMRQSDAQSRAISEQRTLGQAGVRLQQRGLNDARSNAYLTAQMQANQTAGQMNMARDRAAQESYEWSTGRAQDAEEKQKERNRSFWGGILNQGGSIAAAGAGK